MTDPAFRGLRGAASKLGAVALAIALVACGPAKPTLDSGAPLGSLPPEPAAQAARSSADEEIGTGSVRVALIVPLSQASGRSVVGTSLRNAAALALEDVGGNELTLLIKDDHSTPDGARVATQAALSEGAELVIGPLFAANVREAAKVARGAGKPVIALSTDTSTAGGGVYLLSFLADNYVDHIVDYAAAKGKKSIAALIPENDYGRVAEAAFLQAAARDNLRVMAVEHYQPGTLAQAAGKLAALGDQIDSLLIPEQADAMPAVSQALTSAGLDTKRVQILGTGLWNDARVLKLASLQGAWFAAPENGGYNAFAARYRAKFGSDPTRIATLGYDAVSLAAALAHTQGSQRYSENVITNRSGFNGADGVFRFRPDGVNERGLAVLQISNGSTTPISPAPRSFAGAASAT
jgi:ABC-type branched-subunit amino acid transport system substrate-binding protein